LYDFTQKTKYFILEDISMKFTKKFITNVLSIAVIATMLMGAFSYFTDFQSKTLSAKAGNLKLSMTDATEDLTAGVRILNPGDSNELKFTASNDGEKSMDVKAVITVTADQEMSQSSPQYKVTSGGTALTGVFSDDGKSITYTIDDITLSGLNLLHINPGAAGVYGFHKVRTLIRLTIDGSEFKDLEVIELEEK
jgi:hypothetical protein